MHIKNWLYILACIISWYLIHHWGILGICIDAVGTIIWLALLSVHSTIDRGPADKISIDKNLFIAVLFEVSGHMSAAKGYVTAEDKAYIRFVIKKIGINQELQVLAQYAFNMGMTPDYPLRMQLQRLYRAYGKNKRGLMLFCKQLLNIALIDGNIHANEQKILKIVAREFRIPYRKMLIYASQINAQKSDFYSFRQAEKQQYSNQRQYSYQQRQFGQQDNGQQRRQRQKRYQQTSSNNQSNDIGAYQVLEISSSATEQEIKQAYRKLMNKYHPDKLVQQNLSPSELEKATKHAQTIQGAYAYLKQLRGFV